MMSQMASRELEALAKPVRQWIEHKKWTSLRPIQRFAIKILRVQGVEHEDLILSAPTAGGKTAAALLPLMSRLADADAGQGRKHPPQSFEILFVSPLRALIRQQSREENDVVTLAHSVNGRGVHPWMSDISRNQKDRSWDDPSGILLITPESLEALFVHRPHEIASRFQFLTAIVIDELHHYFDNARGAQLISLLKRLDVRLHRNPAQRIALSATLGDGSTQADEAMYRFLRPPRGKRFASGKDSSASPSKQNLKLGEELLDIFINVEKEEDLTDKLEMTPSAIRIGDESAKRKISSALRKIFDGDGGGPKKGLIFTNSRHDAEMYAGLLDGKPLSGSAVVAEELPAAPVDEARLGAEPSDDAHETRRYLPHHGSLSQKARETAESRMLNKEIPAVLVCTTTLELGIDVGEIEEVAQIGPGASVASLRQRLGRSGRLSSLIEEEGMRRTPSTKKSTHPPPPRLHIFLRESKKDESSPLIHRLHLQTFQSLAQVELLREKKYEMPNVDRMNLSTLVQQIVSLIYEHREEGLTLRQAREILVEGGPFYATNEKLYREDAQTVFDAVIQRLKNRSRPLIDFDEVDGLEGEAVQLFLAPEGEGLISRRMIYTAFQTPVEYTVRSASRVLGSASLSNGLSVGDRILFSGRPWEVSEVSYTRRIVYVRPAAGGRAVHFTGDAIPPSEVLVRKMKEIYELPVKKFRENLDAAAHLNSEALAMAIEGHEAFEKERLKDSLIPAKEKGPNLWIYPWLGDRRLNGLYLLLKWAKLPVVRSGLALMVMDMSREDVLLTIRERLVKEEVPPIMELVRAAGGISAGKFNLYLNPSLRRKEFASAQVDLTGLPEMLRSLTTAVS
jgi:ATP-dependent Lhr-like helicase